MSLPALGLALALVGSACTPPLPRGELRSRLAELDAPHVVFIVVDTLRADWTSPYGDTEGLTPELSRWAERGVVFERVRSQSSWTKISMASMMTGLWPHRHGVSEADDGLGAEASTLAERFQEAGYATWGVQTNGWLDQSFGFQQGFDRYLFPTSGGAARLPKPTVWPHADRVVDEARKLVEQRPPDGPFFLYLHFMDVHEYAAPTEFKRYGTDDRGAYRASIRWVDDALERIRKLLQREGLLDRTLLVLASDHGETFGENGKYGHARNVLTAVVSVPLVVRFPFAIESVRVASQVRNIDIGPTLLEAAGLPVPEEIDGESLLGLVSGETPDTADRRAFAALGTPLYPDAAIQLSTTDGAWTYARNLGPEPRRAELLFDRRVDPGENVNLETLEPGELERQRALLDAHLAEEQARGVRESGVRIDPSIAEKLRAMGYLQ